MGAIQALHLRARIDRLPVSPKKDKKGGKTKGKVVKFPLPPHRIKQRGLTDAQRESIVIEHRPKARKLARSILRKWHARLDLEEVDSVVDLSLCEAVKRFNPRKGASFMTFFYYHLRGNLIRTVSIAANSNAIPVVEAEGHRDSSPTERHASSRPVNAIEVAEALCNHENPLPDEMLYKKELSQLSQEACNNLDELEREVIYRVFMEEQQLMDVARVLGYSRCHISRVKKKALEALQNELKAAKESFGMLSSKLAELEPKAGDHMSIRRRGAQRRRVSINRKRLDAAQRVALIGAIN